MGEERLKNEGLLPLGFYGQGSALATCRVRAPREDVSREDDFFRIRSLFFVFGGRLAPDWRVNLPVLRLVASR